MHHHRAPRLSILLPRAPSSRPRDRIICPTVDAVLAVPQYHHQKGQQAITAAKHMHAAAVQQLVPLIKLSLEP